MKRCSTWNGFRSMALRENTALYQRVMAKLQSTGVSYKDKSKIIIFGDLAIQNQPIANRVVNNYFVES